MRFWKYKKKKKREKQTNKRKRKRRKEVRRIYNARLDTVLWLEGGNGIRWTVACEKIVAKKSRRKSLAFLFSVVAVARLAHVVAIRAPPRWKIDATGRPSDDLGPVPTDAASGCRVPSQPFPRKYRGFNDDDNEARFDSITRTTVYTVIPCKAVRK